MKLSVFEDWYKRAYDIMEDVRESGDEISLEYEITFNLINGKKYKIRAAEFFEDEPRDKYSCPNVVESVSLCFDDCVTATFGIDSIISIEW